MKSSLPSATASQKRRFDIIAREIGCIACFIDSSVFGTPGDVHHILSDAKRRIDHDHTIPLCKAHHRTVETKQFRDDYGDEMELLKQTDALVVIFEGNTV